ncbi:MAG: phBC6A51 family helix-turn-helix protein [Solibacillus sp.]
MAKLTLDGLKAKLTPAKMTAAELLLEREYAPKGEKRTLEDIAVELGIGIRTLFEWRKEPAFVQYMAAISDTKLDSYRSLADAQLVRLIQGTSNNGMAAIKALELFYKINGKLVDKREVVTHEQSLTDTLDVNKVKAEIERLRQSMQ